jgi:DNA-binding response OmpR family regulator
MNGQTRVKLLLADNSADYRRSVRRFLELEDYEVEEASTPEQAIELLSQGGYDLIVADLRLSDDEDLDDISGIEVAKAASTLGIPCIIVTAYPTVELARKALRSRGVEPFARDLVPKADGSDALLDSIILTLRVPAPPPPTSLPPLKSRFKVDQKKRLVSKNGVLIRLSKGQYQLVEALYKSEGGVCTDTELVLEVYGEKMNGKAKGRDNRLRNLVERTRKKIDDKDHRYIESVAGQGYRLCLPS